MTALNSKVKIHEVRRLFVGPEYQTDVWASDRVLSYLTKLGKKKRDIRRRFLAKVEYFAENGFWGFESKVGPIKHEWDGVYRVAHGTFLLRLIGFYEDGKRTFIGIDVFEKSGTTLNDSERDRIDQVAKVRDELLWENRDEPNGK